MLARYLRRIRQFFRKGTVYWEIDPDEIFLDSSNLPEFDTSQFEGRLEKPIPKKTFVFLTFVFLLIGLIVLSRIWILQISYGEEYVVQSEKNRLQHSIIFTERGVIYDRNGVELAWNTSGEDDDFSKRSYGDFFGIAHALGYVQAPRFDASGQYYQTEFIGLAGAEELFDITLKGTNGLKIVETNAFGDIQSESLLTPPEDGESIRLSIDVRLQEALYGFIEDLANSVSFVGGAGVVMDVKTGEILALTSFPEYNSEVLSSGEDDDQIRAYIEDDRKPFLNRITRGLYTPGSIVKPFLALGALQERVINPNDIIISTGSITISNPYVEGEVSIFNDWKAHGPVTMREALAVSSNVYFFEIGGGYEGREGLGIGNIEKYMRLMGIGKSSGTRLGIEEEGVVPSPRWKKQTFEDGVWRIGDTYNTAIGQYGFQITPLQVVRAIGAVANSGTLLTPTLILNDKIIQKKIPIREEHFRVVQEGMRLAVTGGTARGLFIEAVEVAAKTGTAEVGSTKKFVNSWVIGYFPYEKPRYAFTIIMERGPADNLLGGAFIMRQLLEWMNLNTPEYLTSLEL